MSLKRCNTSIIGDPPKTQKKFEEEEKEVLRIFAKKRSYQLIPLQCVDDRIRRALEISSSLNQLQINHEIYHAGRKALSGLPDCYRVARVILQENPDDNIWWNRCEKNNMFGFCEDRLTLVRFVDRFRSVVSQHCLFYSMIMSMDWPLHHGLGRNFISMDKRKRSCPGLLLVKRKRVDVCLKSMMYHENISTFDVGSNVERKKGIRPHTYKEIASTLYGKNILNNPGPEDYETFLKNSYFCHCFNCGAYLCGQWPNSFQNDFTCQYKISASRKCLKVQIHNAPTLKALLIMKIRAVAMNFQRRTFEESDVVISLPYQASTFEKGSEIIMGGFHMLPTTLKFETIVDTSNVFTESDIGQYTMCSSKPLRVSNSVLADWGNTSRNGMIAVKVMMCSLAFTQLFDPKFLERFLLGLSHLSIPHERSNAQYIEKALLKNEESFKFFDDWAIMTWITDEMDKFDKFMDIACYNKT